MWGGASVFAGGGGGRMTKYLAESALKRRSVWGGGLGDSDTVFFRAIFFCFVLCGKIITIMG